MADGGTQSGRRGWPVLVILLLAGFVGGVTWSRLVTPSQPAPTAALTSTATRLATATAPPTEPATAIPSSTPTSPATAIQTSSPTATAGATDATAPIGTAPPTATATPPVGQIRNLTACRYGAGEAYMEQRTLFPGERVTVWGRNPTGAWLYVNPPNYLDRCWLEATQLLPPVESMSLPQASSSLPRSDLYSPPRNIKTTRAANQVSITWDPLFVTRQDERGYLFEAWLCQDGIRVFSAEQTTGTSITVVDEGGCEGFAGAQLYTAEIHGYSRPAIVFWPVHPADQ